MAADESDEDRTPVPYGFMFDESRQDPRAREWENERLRLLDENTKLKAELAGACAEKATLVLEKAKLVVEVNNLRRALHRATAKGKEVK